MNVLVIGSSHAAVARLAEDVLLESGRFSTVDWLVTGGNLWLRTEAETGLFRFPAEYERRVASGCNRMYRSKAQTVIHDYDAVCYHSFGLRPHGVDERSPARELARRPCSSALVRALVENAVSFMVHVDNFTSYRATGYRRPIFCSRWIRPHMFLEGVTAEIWTRLCRAETASIEAVGRRFDVVPLPYPPDMDLVTPDHLVQDPTHHGTHGNRAYAEMINRLFLQFLDRSMLPS